ncbi:hypothetical protein DTU32_16265 [Salmonella enterica subsp. enterica serovar Sendai]|nr:hypothetical protein [Salmonella enterica subsp. enterica serovar Sendai]
MTCSNDRKITFLLQKKIVRRQRDGKAVKATEKKSGSYCTSDSVMLTRHALFGWRQQLITMRILFVQIL